jgi:hypothetical protein
MAGVKAGAQKVDSRGDLEAITRDWHVTGRQIWVKNIKEVVLRQNCQNGLISSSENWVANPVGCSLFHMLYGHIFSLTSENSMSFPGNSLMGRDLMKAISNYMVRHIIWFLLVVPSSVFAFEDPAPLQLTKSHMPVATVTCCPAIAIK